MKIGGIKVDKPTEEIVVFEMGGKDVVFKAQAVLDETEFDEICKLPKPPMVKKRGEDEARADFTDKKYNEQIIKYSEKKSHWMILKSLEPSEIEWETVDMKNPDTWENYYKELRKLFTRSQQDVIYEAVMVANGLSDSKIKEARERFLAGERVKVVS